MSNPSYTHIKIGKSSKDPSGDRVRELSNTSVPMPFKVEYKALVEDADTCEKIIHKALSKYRVASNREFFDCNVSLAISTVRELLQIEKEFVFGPANSANEPKQTATEGQSFKAIEDARLREHESTRSALKSLISETRESIKKSRERVSDLQTDLSWALARLKMSGYASPLYTIGIIWMNPWDRAAVYLLLIALWMGFCVWSKRKLETQLEKLNQGEIRDEELKLARCLALDKKKDWRPSDLIMAKSFLGGAASD